MQKKKIVVIGGGAAGMMAAVIAAKEGAAVVLLEKKERLGIKLTITGKGRCNITNDCNRESFIANMPGNGRFLYSAYTAFDKERLLQFFQELGVSFKKERGGRIFTENDNALEIVDALKQALTENNVMVLTNAKVLKLSQNLLKNNSDCQKKDKWTVVCERSGEIQEFKTDAVILATGGASYSATGSTGDGYLLAKKLGHKITDVLPSLVPLETSEELAEKLQGLSLRNIKLTLTADGKKIAEEFGEMLFTHFGVSGPCVLTLSRKVVELYRKREKEKSMQKIQLEINLKPALSEEQLDKRLLRDFSLNQRRIFKNALSKLLPKKMIEVFIEYSGIESERSVHQITKKERLNLVRLLQHFSFEIKGIRSIDEAIVTRGGISIKEIEPSTMQSKLIRDLYFSGEIIDVDGFTGGFNLQAAFSTGYLAGKNSVASV